VLQELLHEPAWLKQVLVEMNQELGGLQIVVQLLKDDRYIQACIPSHVNDVPVVTRLATLRTG
jgi:hypothetical protein